MREREKAIRRAPRASRWAMVLAVATSLFPAAVVAQNPCPDMLVTVVRFTGTVHSVEPLARPRQAAVTDVFDIDPRYVVAVAVDAVEPNATVAPGSVLHFAVHSPSRTFGARTRAGSVRDLELEVSACEGAFWRFFGLRRRASAEPEAFTGELEVGRTYRVGLRWDPEDGRALEGSLDLPIHHEGDRHRVREPRGRAGARARTAQREHGLRGGVPAGAVRRRGGVGDDLYRSDRRPAR